MDVWLVIDNIIEGYVFCAWGDDSAMLISYTKNISVDDIYQFNYLFLHTFSELFE